MEQRVFDKIVRSVTRAAVLAALSTISFSGTASAVTAESRAKTAISEVDAHSQQVAAARATIHPTENTARSVAKRPQRALPALSKQDCVNGLCRRHVVLMLGVGF